jgi:hypothetical protein
VSADTNLLCRANFGPSLVIEIDRWLIFPAKCWSKWDILRTVVKTVPDLNRGLVEDKKANDAFAVLWRNSFRSIFSRGHSSQPLI